jgi:hypothetical protein
MQNMRICVNPTDRVKTRFDDDAGELSRWHCTPKFQ